MKRLLIAVSGGLALGAAGIPSVSLVSPLFAQSAASEAAASEVRAVQTATFAVENMTCALCPVTVKSAMARVEGVRSVEIDFEAKTAIVVFDPSITMPEAIAAASTNAGYPATARS